MHYIIHSVYLTQRDDLFLKKIDEKANAQDEYEVDAIYLELAVVSQRDFISHKYGNCFHIPRPFWPQM